jgi:predicted nucleic-acid-binding protein
MERYRAGTYLIDTNLIVRVIVGDPPKKAREAGQLFDDAARDGIKLRLIATVVAESFYVLTSYYEMERAEAAEVLTAFVRQPSLVVDDRQVLLRTLELVATKRQKFVDCLLVAQAEVDRQGVATQDAGIDKLADVPVLMPQGSKGKGAA